MGKITLQDIKEMMADAESIVDDESPDYIQVLTRYLTDEEIHEVWEFMVGLPDAVWSEQDRAKALVDLLEARRAHLIMKPDQQAQAVYCKVKWG